MKCDKIKGKEVAAVMAASSNGSRAGRAEGTLKALQPYQWKPGQSGNPKGPPPGSRRKLSEEFLADLHAAWRAYGRPALMTAAFTDPVSFVRVVASLMPKRAGGHRHRGQRGADER